MSVIGFLIAALGAGFVGYVVAAMIDRFRPQPRVISIDFSAELVERLLDAWSEPSQVRIVKSGDRYVMQARTCPQPVDKEPAKDQEH